MVRLHLHDFARPGQFYHVARHLLANTAHHPSHSHHFLEIFHVEKGEGWHRINGTEHALQAGDLVMIRAADSHALRAAKNHTLQIFNLAFAQSLWDYLRRRYSLRDLFKEPLANRTFRFTEAERLDLESEANDLELGDRSRLKIERFLINLAHRLLRPSPAPPDGVPDWLQQACRKIREGNHFSGGSRAFVKLAGRSPEHVARATRKWLGRSPTEIVNEQRMAYAAGQLARTGRPIVEIALDCGLENLSHFYLLFRSSTGLSPLRYRRQQQRIISAQPLRGSP